eukprot:jgi/Mesvir1/16091/Mv08385-RA.1
MASPSVTGGAGPSMGRAQEFLSQLDTVAVRLNPDEQYASLLANNTTHFTPEELERLLIAFKRVTNDRLQEMQFIENLEVELGWSSLMLRKQLFAAFDVDAHGDITFEEFVRGYSTMLRGTVPELLDFVWRVYHVSNGPSEDLLPADMYTVLKLALHGAHEARHLQLVRSAAAAPDPLLSPRSGYLSPRVAASQLSPRAGDSMSVHATGGHPPPSVDALALMAERAAQDLVWDALVGSQAPVTRAEFNRLVLRHRALVDCLVPGFEALPHDPVHRAAEAGEAEEVARLLDREGFDVDGRDASAWPTTPLHLAARFGHVPVVEVLLAHGANVRLLSARTHTPDAHTGVKPRATDARLGTRSGHAGNAVAEEGEGGQTALQIAVLYGREAVVKLLLEAGAGGGPERDAQGKSAVHIAATEGRVRELRLLMPAMEEESICQLVDKEGNTPLHSLAAADNWLAFEVFLEFGKLRVAEVDQRNARGETALLVAARHGGFQVAQKLLELGADPNATDVLGVTVLHAAVMHPDNEAAVKLLLADKRVAVNEPDSDGRAPLHSCVATRNIKILKALLSADANPNLQEHGTGLTPLHKCVIANWLAGVELLVSLEQPKVLLLPDTHGCSPLDYARVPRIISLLADVAAQAHPVWTPQHPVPFILGLVFYEGRFHRMGGPGGGERWGKRQARTVGRRVLAERERLGVVDKAGVKERLVAAGAIVLEEPVLLRRGRNTLDQYSLLRVGAPLFRLQQEAMKMRLQVRRMDLDRFEDYHLDHSNFPDRSFVPLSLPERQQIMLHLVQSQDHDDATQARYYALRQGHESADHGSGDGANSHEQLHQVQVQPPASAGILLSDYRRLRVVHDLVVLHDVSARAVVASLWTLRQLRSAAFWREHLSDYFHHGAPNALAASEAAARAGGKTSSKYHKLQGAGEVDVDVRQQQRSDEQPHAGAAAGIAAVAGGSGHTSMAPMEALPGYFGHKVAFAVSFLSFLDGWLVGPSMAGALVFGLEFIPSEYASIVQRPVGEVGKLDDTYDHPLMFALAAFMAFWGMLAMRAWRVREGQLAVQWGVAGFVDRNPAAHPWGPGVARLEFDERTGMWVGRLEPKGRSAQAWRRRAVLALITLPGILVMAALMGGLIYLGIWIMDKIEESAKLTDAESGNLNMRGRLASYAITGAYAGIIWLLNQVGERIALAATRRGGHVTLASADANLAVTALLLRSLVTFASLFYYAYGERDVDRTAEQLAAILIVGELLDLAVLYAWPAFSARQRRNRARGWRGAADGQGLGASRKAPASHWVGSNGHEAARSSWRGNANEAGGDDEETRGLMVAGSQPGTPAASGPLGLPYPPKAPPTSLAMAVLKSNASGFAHPATPVASPMAREPLLPSPASAAQDAPPASELPLQGVSSDSGASEDVVQRSHSHTLELARAVVLFGLLTMFGAVWPLAPLVAIVIAFLEVRLGVWKLCTHTRRPFAERARGLGPLWQAALAGMALAGVANHAFIVGVSSNTIKEYFFPGISTWQRVAAAFLAITAVLLAYAVYTTFSTVRDPLLEALEQKEPLRFVRDAYRIGHQLREMRYRMMHRSPGTTFEQVCAAQGVDPVSAYRYLMLTRFLDSLPQAERRMMLVDDTTTIQAMVTKVLLRKLSGQWVDAGERPTLEGLLLDIMPNTNVRQTYVLGKALRETAFRLWAAQGSAMAGGVAAQGAAPVVKPSGAHMAAILHGVRHFACIEHDCTLAQAERALLLVRFVDAQAANPWDKINELRQLYPSGLPEVLNMIGFEMRGDAGEPSPARLGPLVEPLALARQAYAKGAVVRRKMYEFWLFDKAQGFDELVWKVCYDTGDVPSHLQRCLLIKRYCDTLNERKRKDLLDFARTTTLSMVGAIQQLINAGEWKDPGEPSFRTYVPPIVSAQDDGQPASDDEL